HKHCTSCTHTIVQQACQEGSLSIVPMFGRTGTASARTITSSFIFARPPSAGRNPATCSRATRSTCRSPAASSDNIAGVPGEGGEVNGEAAKRQAAAQCQYGRSRQEQTEVPGTSVCIGNDQPGRQCHRN